jgi:hypothetical protein
MPLRFNKCDCSPLVIDNEIVVTDEEKLSEYIGFIILGYYRHVLNIINSKGTTTPKLDNDAIDLAIAKLKKKAGLDTDKRDGWIFQMISWIALRQENNGKDFYCQQPHEAPAQHGIDGLAVVLDTSKVIKNIIITEDKCTEHPRGLITQKIWPEFTNYEQGNYNHKLVSKVSSILTNMDDHPNLLKSIYDDPYNKSIRIYRVGITRDIRYKDTDGRRKLFKDYDQCVEGPTCERRSGSTLYNEDIRKWMEKLSRKIVKYLQSKKSSSV